MDQPLDLKSLQSLESWSAPHIDPIISDPQKPRSYLWIAQHGYQEIDHEMGVFSFKCIQEDSKSNTITLDIDLKRAGIANHEHHIKAKITCKNDLFSTPVQWYMKSDFTNSEDQLIPRYSLIKQGFYQEGYISETVNGANHQFQIANHWLSDYSLPASFQGSLVDVRDSIEFDYFQEFSLLKKNQTLHYAGKEQISLYDESVNLLYFQHFGIGNLPYEYWVTESGVLLLAVNAFNIWMLHDEPEAHYQNHINRLKNR